MNLRRLFSLTLLLALLGPLSAQDLFRPHYTFATFYEGDTIPLYYLKQVDVWGSYLLLTQKEINKNGKLIRNVKIMLPYAREAKRRLDVLEVEIAQMAPKERKAARPILKTVQDRMGHANGAITLNWYAHAVPENDEKAAQLVGEIFKPTPNKARVVDLKTA